MQVGDTPVLRVEGVVKGYHGLRPLRLASLTVMPAERVTIAGIDVPGAELMVNLITGAALPDEGDVWTFGRRTAEITSGDDWLQWLDHFGIVSDRGVLLEGSTLEQNLAMPFTLDIDPVPADVSRRAAALASECGLPEELLPAAAGTLAAEARVRAHFARAVALAPRLLLMEHPTGRLAPGGRAPLADDVARVCEARGLPAVIFTNDEVFAEKVAPTNLKLDGATGRLQPARKKGWFKW